MPVAKKISLSKLVAQQCMKKQQRCIVISDQNT